MFKLAVFKFSHFKKIILFLSIVFSFVFSFSYSASLKLVDEKSKAVKQLEVFFEETAEIAVSDNNGVIELKEELIGKESKGSIVLISEEFQKTKFEISFKEDVVLTLNQKKKDLKTITSVKVTGKNYKRTEQKISKKQLKENIQYNLGDVVKTLQTRPGVSSSGSSFSSDMYIQGGSGEEWVGILDHIWVLQPRRWNNRISMFNPLTIEAIDFYTAGYPSSVGQGLSGILWVNTLKPDPQKWNFYLSFDAGLEALAHGYLTKDVAVFFNIRRLWLDLVIDLAQTDDRDGEKFKNPYIFDGMAKIIWEINRYNHLQFLFYFSNEGLDNVSEFGGSSISATPSPNAGGQVDDKDEEDKNLSSTTTFYDTHLIYALKHTLRFSAKNYLVFNGAILPQFDNVKQLDNDDFTVTNEQKSLSWQLTMDYALDEIENHSLRMGLFYYNYNSDEDGEINYNYFTRNAGEQYTDKDGNVIKRGDYIRTNDSRKLEDEIRNSEVVSGYFSDDWVVNNFLTLRYGVRMNHYEIGEETHGEIEDNFLSFIVGDNFKRELTIEPRAEMVVNLNKNLNIFTKGGYYTSSNPLNRNFYGVPKTTSEKSTHSVTGINFRNFYFEFLAEGFYKNYWHLRELDGNLQLNNYGERISYGGNIYLSLNENPASIFHGYTSYTYTDAKQKVTKRDNEEEINTLVDPYYAEVNKEYDPSFLREHTFNIFLKVYPIKPFKIGGWMGDVLSSTYFTANFSALSGKPYTKAIDVEKNNNNLRIIYGDYNVDRLEPIHNLSLQIGQRITRHFEWFVSFINVLSTENVLEYSYNVKASHKNNIANYKEGERLGKDAVQRNKVLDSASSMAIRGGFKIFF